MPLNSQHTGQHSEHLSVNEGSRNAFKTYRQHTGHLSVNESPRNAFKQSTHRGHY